LDVDLNKIPNHLLKEEDPIFAFNKAIIDATHHLCVAYKPNTAFGGNLQEVCKYGMNASCGLLVNSSRGIIYASHGEDFAEAAAKASKALQEQMAVALSGF